MKTRTFTLAVAVLSGLTTAAFAQGTPGTTGGAAGSAGGGQQTGRTTAPAGSNGNASTPAPAGGGRATESTSSGTYGGTQIPGHGGN